MSYKLHTTNTLDMPETFTGYETQQDVLDAIDRLKAKGYSHFLIEPEEVQAHLPEVPLTDEQEAETVDLVASGYEWICPNCDHFNHEIEANAEVTCRECGRTYETNPPEHAIG